MTTTREAKLKISAQDKASPVLGRIGRNLANLGRSAGLSRLGQQFGNMTRSLRGLAGAAGGAVRAVGSLAGLAAGGGIAGLAVALRSSANELDRIAKIGRDLGMPVQELRQLGYIGGMVGVEMGTLEGALRTSARGFDQMRNGVGRLHSQLRNTNPELHRQISAATDSRQAFGLMLDAIRQTGTEAERIRLAEMFFGSSDMTRIAALSVEEMGSLRSEADRILGRVTDEQAAAVEEYNDAIGKLSSAFKGLADAISTDLLPKLTPLVSTFGEWVANNREFIAQNVSESVQKVANALAAVDWGAFARGLGEAFAKMDRFADMVGGWSNVVLGLATLAMYPLAKAVTVAALEIGKLGALMMTTPIGWAAAAIGGTALVIWRNWEDIGPRFDRLWDSLGEMAGGFVDTFSGLMRGDLSAAGEGVSRMFTGWRESWAATFDVLAGISRGFATEIDGIFGTDLVGHIDRMNQFWASVPERWGTVADALSATLSAWWDRERAAFFGAIEIAGEKLGGLFDGVATAWSSALDGVRGILSGFLNWFDTTFIGPILAGIQRVTDGWNAVTTFFGGGGERTEPDPRGGRRPRIQPRAMGGLVEAGSAYMVGEQGRELFMPATDGNIVPNDLLRRMVQSGVVQRGGSGTIEGAAELNVRFDNAPQGVRASASSDGRLFRRVRLDTGRRMRPAYDLPEPL